MKAREATEQLIGETIRVTGVMPSAAIEDADNLMGEVGCVTEVSITSLGTQVWVDWHTSKPGSLALVSDDEFEIVHDS